jgi:hypothetical protein
MVTFEICPLPRNSLVKEREETRFISSLLRVELGPLPHKRKGGTAKLFARDHAGPLWRTSRLQRAVLFLLTQKPYTLSDLSRILNKRLCVLWRSVRGLDQRGLLAHVWVTGCNYFGCPLTRHYFALRSWAGTGSMTELLELGMRVLFLAARENTEAIARQKECYYREMRTCVISGSRHHTRQRALKHWARLTADTQPATLAQPPRLVLTDRGWAPGG